MTPQEYQDAVKSTTMLETHGLSCEQLIGLAGEVGELCNLMKKKLFYRQEINAFAFEEEVGDVLWYLNALINGEGLSLEGVMVSNALKLRRRFPSGFRVEDTKPWEGKK